MAVGHPQSRRPLVGGRWASMELRTTVVLFFFGAVAQTDLEQQGKNGYSGKPELVAACELGVVS